MSAAGKIGGLIVTACAALTAALPSPAAAQAITLKERIVLGSFNMCWEGEEGKNLTADLRDNGFALAPQATNNLYFRQEGDTTLLFGFWFGKDKLDRSEAFCSVTALKPQIVSPWTPKGAILPAFDQLLDRIIASAANMGPGYRTVQVRQPIPGQPGMRRTLLHATQGTHGRIIFIDEGPTLYEFGYYNAHSSVIKDPAMWKDLVQPSTRNAKQMMVDDKWEIAFCNLNPHNCLTKEQQRQQEMAAAQARQQGSRNTALPFSGIGSIRSGDNRTNQQRLNDKAWWENYHRCGRGKC